MITKEIYGSILNTELDYMAHGVNAQGKMGSGIAKILSDEYPEVKERYLEFCKGKNDFELLGKIQTVRCKDKYVLNCFTQKNYGYDGQLYLSYGAIEEIFSTLNNHYDRIAIPKIGCGLAGGSWSKVSKIINECTPDLEVWVYYV